MNVVSVGESTMLLAQLGDIGAVLAGTLVVSVLLDTKRTHHAADTTAQQKLNDADRSVGDL